MSSPAFRQSLIKHTSTSINKQYLTSRTRFFSTTSSTMSDSNQSGGILNQAADSVKAGANYVSDTIQGKSAEASKEANKEQAKGNVPGNDSLSDRVSGATGAISDKMTESKHDASAEANKRQI